MKPVNAVKKWVAALSVMFWISNCSLMAATVATQLSFTVQPSNTVAGARITTVVVQVKDKNGANKTTKGVAISLALNKTATLTGLTNTTTDATGKATFTNLVVLTAGSGFSLQASATGLKSATSSAFDVAKAGTSTALTTTLNPAQTSQLVTFAAAISPATTSDLKPSGVVQFKSNGTNKLGNAITVTNGAASLTVLAASLGATNATITAEYSDPAGNYNSSTNALVQKIASVTLSKSSSLSLTPSGAHKGWFNAKLTGAASTIYVIQTSTDMVHWVSLATNTTDISGTISLVDSNSISSLVRFYRAYAP